MDEPLCGGCCTPGCVCALEPRACNCTLLIGCVLKKSMKLREEAAAKELEDAKDATESSAQKLRKILKDEKR